MLQTIHKQSVWVVLWSGSVALWDYQRSGVMVKSLSIQNPQVKNEIGHHLENNLFTNILFLLIFFIIILIQDPYPLLMVLFWGLAVKGRLASRLNTLKAGGSGI